MAGSVRSTSRLLLPRGRSSTTLFLEVCSTTLPQKAIPPILSHPEYPGWLEERIDRYEKFSNIAYDILKEVPEIKVNRTNGAFYMSVAFREGVLNHSQTLPIDNPEVKTLVEGLVSEPAISPDTVVPRYAVDGRLCEG